MTRGRGVQKKLAKKREIEYISVPKHWFTDPLLHAMKTVVRPPTKMTRRKQMTFDVKLPVQTFLELVMPFETGDCKDFEWLNDEKTALKPTQEAKTFTRYKYTIAKPALNDKLWRLEEHEPVPAPPTDKNGNKKQFRRGHGASRLHLSFAAQERGERTDLLSSVTGNTVLNLKVPKDEKAMPTLRITCAASTMSPKGHIEWANTYDAKTSAALRKRMRFHLDEMIKSNEYPTGTHMALALMMQSESVRRTVEPRTNRLLLCSNSSD